MATTDRRRTRAGGSTRRTIELPENREYETEADAALDAALTDAIEQAEAANHDYLARLLRCELGSLQYERGTPE